jgi:hypothetical protein
VGGVLVEGGGSSVRTVLNTRMDGMPPASNRTGGFAERRNRKLIGTGNALAGAAGSKGP